jgi:RNA polymerase sigma-70 factor, ECF subfamily
VTYSAVEYSDEELMQRAARGEEDAFALLVHRYEKPLYGYARRMLGNSAEAEDVFQETFLRVYQHRNQYRVGAPFRPWLYQIATNLCRDRLRSRRRHPLVSLDAPAVLDADCPAQLDRVTDGHADPAQAARKAEATARLETALSELPGKQKAVFLMARCDNMPYEEIARSLQVPVGTVKSRMNKAVHFLMQAVRDIWP